MKKIIKTIIIVILILSCFEISVFSADIAVNEIVLNKKEYTFGKIENTMQLQATFTPSNATNKNISWSSSNTNIATVDSSGKVTAKASGECKIMARSNNGKYAECKITINSNYNIQTNKPWNNESVVNSTVWNIIEVGLYQDNSLKNKISTISALQEGIIIQTSGDNFKVTFTNGKTGWVNSKYLLINLPDVRSDIKFNITNAYSSIFKIGSKENKCQMAKYNTYQKKDTPYTSGFVNIPNITGKALYTYDSNDGKKDGKVYNSKLGRDEFVCPVLYKFAKKLGRAQNIALQNGYCLKIYDGYRPQSVCDAFYSNSYKIATDEKNNMKAVYLTGGAYGGRYNASVSGNGTCYNGNNGGLNITCFVAANKSDHAGGYAVDVTMVFKNNKEKEIPTQCDIHDLSANATKWVNKGNKNSWGTRYTDILNDIMVKAEMKPLTFEWWHYSDSSLDVGYGNNNIKYTKNNLPDVRVNYSQINYINKDITATITTTKPINNQPSGWTISKDKKTLTKIYKENNNETVKLMYSNGVEISKNIVVRNIDKTGPSINNVTGNPAEYTNKNVILTVSAKDSQSGLNINAYSFDGGKTWQSSNKKTYKNNTSGIEIKVRDKAGNTSTYKDIINITKIDKTGPTINSVTGNPTQYTNKSVTLTVNAKDSQSGLNTNAYSFDGGKTWQSSNQKTYTINTSGIVVKVKDKLRKHIYIYRYNKYNQNR